MSAKRIAVRVTPAAERQIRDGHPWLFDRAIREQSHEGAAGDLAVIFDRKRRFLAIGLYDPHSPIRVRILHQGSPATIDAEWFYSKMNAAAAARAHLTDTQTNGYRVIHGENDGLPGLVVDRYAETLVVKLYSHAWFPHLTTVLDGLAQILPNARVVLRLSRALSNERESQDGAPAYLDGQIVRGDPLDGSVVFLENGLYFEADPVHGQKTGFFLDQRDNRERVGDLSAGKRVLNVFAYTGGFSLYAARGGAAEVTSLDISQPALDGAARNFALNETFSCEHLLLKGDAFQLLADLHESRRSYDLIVIDPPALAKRQSEIDGAVSAYARLTRLGLDLLAPNGTIALASCSSRVDSDLFGETVHLAARHAGRPLREFLRTGHAVDHPIGFKEGAYLKCIFANG